MKDVEKPIELPPISVFQLKRHEGQALTNEQIVRALLRFANTGSYAARVALQTSAVPEDLAQHGDKPLTRGIQPGQQELRDALDLIVKGKGKVSESLAALWRRRAASLLFLRVFVPGGKHRYRWEQFESWKTEPSPVIANALLLLLEQESILCRCGYDKCKRFFFAAQPEQRRGRPITEYCPGTDHRDLARPAKVRDRRATLRAERAARKHK
jgi:hypothetical protein